MQTVNGKMPIVSGMLNRMLNLEEILQFDYETKKSICWSLILGIESGTIFRNVNINLYTEELRSKPISYSEIPGMDGDINLFCEQLYDNYQQLQIKLTKATELYNINIGKSIYKFQKENGFTADYELHYACLMGYIRQLRSWNNFESSKVIKAISDMQSYIPKMEYGLNNPNNGSDKHKWHIKGDYIYVELFLSDDEIPRYEAFFREHWYPTGQKINADSTRMSCESHDHGYSTLTMIWWWD